MIWIILAILVVGYFIVRAINRNTVNNAAIAQQQYLNSPEHRKQAQASMAYWGFLKDVLDVEVRIAEKKLKLLDTPAQYHIVTSLKTGEHLSKMTTLTDKHAIRKLLREEIKDEEQLIEGLRADYEKGKAEYSGFHAEDLDTMRVKYELDVPFPPDFEHDYFNEDNASSWSMYTDNQAKLRGLEATLRKLADPKTRKTTIENLNKGDANIDGTVLTDDELFKAAVSVVVENRKAGTSLLQRRLRLGYGRAARLIEEMEEKGLISPADGARPREVLISESEINKLVS